MLNIGAMRPGALDNEHIRHKIAWQSINLRWETKNAVANYESIRKHHGDRIRCLEKAPRGAGPILVCASGSSVNQVMPRIAEWPGAIMCSSTQASTLIYHGASPDYMVAIDPRIDERELHVPDWGKTSLICHPSVHAGYIHHLLSATDNPIYMYRLMEPTYDWYSHHLPWMYADHDEKRGKVTQWFERALAPFLDSTSAEINLAHHLGYNPIYLAGVDYQGPRFDQTIWTGSEWEEHPASRLDAAAPKEEQSETHQNMMSINGAHHLAYTSRGAMITAFQEIQRGARIYQLSKDSLVPLPPAEWEEVLERGGIDDQEEWHGAPAIHELEVHMAGWATYMVPLRSGFPDEFNTYILDDPRQTVQTVDASGKTAERPALGALLMQLNNELDNNKRYFSEVTKRFGASVFDLIHAGIIAVQGGTLLLHTTEEIRSWDWREIEPVNVELQVERCGKLYDEAKERGLIRKLKAQPDTEPDAPPNPVATM